MLQFRHFALVLGAVLAGCGAAATTNSAADAEADVAGTDAQALDAADAADASPGTDAVADSGATDASADTPDSQPGTDAVADTPDSQPGTDATADTSDATAADTATTDTTVSNPCQQLGGICASNSGDCTSGGGTYQAAGDSGCVFDDGPGACCIPPKMTQAKATCADYGGICAPIAGCNFVQGAYAAYEGCKGIPMICCVPHSICGDENESCCDSMTTYRTACDHGAWICTIDGTTMKPTDQCPK